VVARKAQPSVICDLSVHLLLLLLLPWMQALLRVCLAHRHTASDDDKPGLLSQGRACHCFHFPVMLPMLLLLVLPMLRCFACWGNTMSSEWQVLLIVIAP